MRHARQRGICAASLLLFTACSGDPAEPGLHFESTLVDVGRLYAGPTLPIVFPFVNGPVQIHVERLETSCGCLEPQLWIGTEMLRLPAVVPAGARGSVRTEYHTEGYSGRKRSGVTLHGAGPGLPLALVVDSILDTWLKLEPEVLRFGVVDGLQERALRVRVRGEKPFRLLAPLAGAPGLSVRGAPSTSIALEHEVEIVLEASEEDGPHASFLSLGADNGESVRLPVAWEVAGPLYVIPNRLLPLHRVPPGVAVSAAIEVGVRIGSLEPPEVLIEELEGVQTRVRTLQEGSRYRIDLSLPDDLPVGAFSGWVRLRLRHSREGGVKELERSVRLLGVVQAESKP